MRDAEADLRAPRAKRTRRWYPLSCAMAIATGAAGAAAELPSQVEPLDTRTDGVYGRLDGDVTLSVELLLDAAPGGPAPGVRAAAHYYWMAGVYAGYSRMTRSSATDQVASVGLDLRPAFLPRWLLGLQRGPGWLDLTLDSISVSAGPYWGAPQDGDFGDELGLDLGLGIAFPLMSSARGLWFSTRGFRRFADERNDAWVAQAGLCWYQPWLSPLLD